MNVTVHVKPRAKKTVVSRDIDGNFTVWVTAPPVGGQANRVVQEVLAEYFNISKSRVHLVQGAKSKTKVFMIDQ